MLTNNFKPSHFQYVGDFDLLGVPGAVSSGVVGAGSSPFSDGATGGTGCGASKTGAVSPTGEKSMDC